MVKKEKTLKPKIMDGPGSGYMSPEALKYEKEMIKKEKELKKAKKKQKE